MWPASRDVSRLYRPRRPGGSPGPSTPEVAHQECCHLAGHCLVRVDVLGEVLDVADDAFNAYRVEPGLGRRAEAGVMDALAGASVGGERLIGLGVEEDRGRVAGRGVVDGRGVLEEPMRPGRPEVPVGEPVEGP